MRKHLAGRLELAVLLELREWERWAGASHVGRLCKALEVGFWEGTSKRVARRCCLLAPPAAARQQLPAPPLDALQVAGLMPHAFS